MKKIELEEQDDGKTVRCRIKEGSEVVTVRYFRKDMVDSIIKKAKKEVFDDIDKLFPKKDVPSGIAKIYFEFKEIQERHLSTFQKEKRHNSSFIQDCPLCKKPMDISKKTGNFVCYDCSIAEKRSPK